MRSIVIGTAGHIDHGKTALVKALTGTDTDRLKEEKARGITIELGFAQMQLDDELHASIIDVPGHERFVRAMVAGTMGIDFVLMVVAADEAVMPQTREHLDICNILGVKRGLVALTKVDLVDDPEWLDMVIGDLRSELKGTFLYDSPIISVSSRTGQGLEVLKEAIRNLANKITLRAADSSTFLAIDRAFTMRGFGTVVTGTLTSGSFGVEDLVDILPDRSGRLNGLKIRGLQVHGKKVEKADAGRRCAVNLSGIDHALLSRGQVVTHTGTVRAESDFVCTLRLVPGVKILRTRIRAAFHTGTIRTMATVRLINSDRLTPDKKVFVAIHCDTPVAALPRHRYILRGSVIIEGRGTTIGGGEILSNMPSRRLRKDKQNWIDDLEQLEDGDHPRRLEILFRQAGPKLLDSKEIGVLSGIDQSSIQRVLPDLTAKKAISRIESEPPRFVDTRALEGLSSKTEEILGDYHKNNLLLPGMPSEQVRQGLQRNLDMRLFKLLTDGLVKQGQVVQEGEILRLAEHRVKLSGSDTELESKLRKLFTEAKLAPPFVNEIAEKLSQKPSEIVDMLKHLTRKGILTFVSGQMYISTDELGRLRSRLIAHLEEKQEISIQELKDLVGSSRKHAIPLAEYFDQEKTTLRVGPKRVLRRK